jgi:hypothetical protein
MACPFEGEKFSTPFVLGPQSSCHHVLPTQPTRWPSQPKAAGNNGQSISNITRPPWIAPEGLPLNTGCLEVDIGSLNCSSLQNGLPQKATRSVRKGHKEFH